MSTSRDLFRFAAKAGSLEGYLYDRTNVESLANWVANIDRMYRDLPEPVRREIHPDLREIIGKVLAYGERTVELSLRDTLMHLMTEP